MPVRTPNGFPNAERQAFPVDPFSYSEPRFFYLAPATFGRVYCHCFPAKSFPEFCGSSVGWHLDSLLPHFCYLLLFVLSVTCGTGSVVPTGIVEAPGGRARDTPVQ